MKVYEDLQCRVLLCYSDDVVKLGNPENSQDLFYIIRFQTKLLMPFYN